MWNFQFMDNFGGKEWPGRALDAANWSRWVLWVLFVMNASEYTQKQFIKLAQPAAARRMKKWNSSEQSIHMLMSALNDSVFKNCLHKKTSWIIVYALTIWWKLKPHKQTFNDNMLKRNDSFNCQNEVCR